MAITPPYLADCSRFHLFGEDEAATVLNRVDGTKPMSKIGTPTINANHCVCTPASGFQTPAAPYYGGTQVLVVSMAYVLATRASTLNIHYLDRGGAYWARQTGANLLFRADGGLSGTELQSAVSSGVRYVWSPYVERPAVLSFTASVGDQRMHLEEGTEYRPYSGAPSALSARANAALRIGGYNGAGGDLNGFEAYLLLEYTRQLSADELETLLHDFVQPVLEWRGVRRYAELRVTP